MSKLIITEGERIYCCGDTKVVGVDWVYAHDLKMKICCDQLSGIYVFKEIPFDVFRYSLSRLRGIDKIDKDHNRTPVFANRQGVYFSGKLGWQPDLEAEKLNLDELQSKWTEFWIKYTLTESKLKSILC